MPALTSGAGRRLRARPLFLAAIALSAWLLFTTELLAGRLVLPVFGGTPGVWTTALCLFTGVVFAGYLYAHLVASRLSRRAGANLHLGVIAAAAVLTLVGPHDAAALRDPALPEALNVIVALLVLVGPILFVLSTTTPLLSTWFAESGRDPWWLYAVSNGASLAALLAYPFLVQPAIPLSAQLGIVIAGYVLYGVLVAAIVVGGWTARSPARPDETRTGAPGVDDRPAPIGRARMARWLFAAMVPAGLLSATTTFLATDLVSAPLLWVGPLAIYLASMTIAFSARGRRALGAVELLVPGAAVLLWVPFVLPVGWPIAALVAIELGAFGVIAVAVHGRLALDRPDERHLTAFYLVLSAGGVLATGLVALVAPLVFPIILEYPVLLVGALVSLAILPGPRLPSAVRTLRGEASGAAQRLLPYLVAVAVLVGLLLVDGGGSAAVVIAALFAIGGVLVVAARTPAMLAVGTAGLLAVLLVAISSDPLVRVRNFFGVTEVRSMEDGTAHGAWSGTTLHGLQYLDERRGEPTAYYVEPGPVGDIFRELRGRLGDGRGARIGVVGLGTGTLAVYGRDRDGFDFYEIDPAVIDLANDPRWFTYLRDTRAEVAIVRGDARLSLADARPAAYDLLVLDAFSSDSVPAHLLTREAVEGYARVLAPGGVMLFNVSNRYYDLPGAVVATARSAGLAAAARGYVPAPSMVDRYGAQGSSWVAAGDPAAIERLAAAGWGDPERPGPVLTDDFSDLLRLLYPADR